MKSVFIGDEDAEYCLVQTVDEHDEAMLDKEWQLIKEQCPEKQILIAAVRVDNWNKDLSPWVAAPVFGKESFGDGAADTLQYILQELIPMVEKDILQSADEVKYIIGGYSLAGLFALWASCQTTIFKASMAASPSVWFSGWLDYQQEHPIQTDVVYLSLGDKEEKTRNPQMAKVGDCIRRQAELVKNKTYLLEWNEGNHFKDFEIRNAKGFSWCIKQLSSLKLV